MIIDPEMPGARESEREMTPQERYADAAHAMQSGVAAKMTFAPAETQPKHLRVGVNSAMVETSAIVELLAAKGIITMDEWYEALATAMEREAKLYQDEVSRLAGTTVTLR